jgi:hypothetical protein
VDNDLLFFEKAGLGLRIAQPSDIRFVVSSWHASAFKPFLEGKTPCPWPNLEITVLNARRAGNLGLLQRIYHAEMKGLIRAELASSPTLVVFDVENPSFLVAWGHRAYRYTKQAFRRQGIGSLLRAACL